MGNRSCRVLGLGNLRRGNCRKLASVWWTHSRSDHQYREYSGFCRGRNDLQPRQRFVIMALIFADRTMESSTTTGTGPIALGGALTGMQAFSASMAVGDTIYYAANGIDSNGNTTANWEVGLGTYSAASTLTRSVILASSNAGAAVSWPTGYSPHAWG